MRFWGSRRSRALRLVFLIPLLGAWAMFTTTPAGATTASYTNPTACSVSVQNGVCISTISVEYTATAITLSVTVGKATDPMTDPNWQSVNTAVSWGIYAGGASSPTYVAEVSETTGSTPTFAGAVGTEGPGGSPVCYSTATPSSATPSFDASADSYQISFAASCIGNPASVSVTAQFDYDDNGDALSTSFLPTAPCCSATPDAATTTTSSTTATTTTTTTTSTTSTTTTTVSPSTTTTVPLAVVSTSPSSTGNSGSGSTGLASTGPGTDTPVLLVVGACLISIGVLGRRRILGLARRAARPRVR
jgi:LPXTG-motif cell wall-anchored protein